MTGRRLFHYEILEKLGEGGMGVVYKARDTRLDRLVALKLLPADKVSDLERKRRFFQEARAQEPSEIAPRPAPHRGALTAGLRLRPPRSASSWRTCSLRPAVPTLRPTASSRWRLE